MIDDTGELYRRYKNMQGKEIYKITILAETNDIPAKKVKEIIEQERAKEEKLTAICNGDYDPDENPYCKVEPKAEVKTEVNAESVSEWVTNMIFQTLDVLEVEIKQLEKTLAAKREEYEKLTRML